MGRAGDEKQVISLQWPKRVEAEALGARKFRDNQDTTGTRPKIPGLSRPCIPGRLATMRVESGVALLRAKHIYNSSDNSFRE